MVRRKGWRRLSKPGDKLQARWRHEASGWEVHHCGHPTANWPYAARDPEHPHALTADRSGRGFRTLEVAFWRVEGVIEGTLRTFDDGPCKHGYRRVICDPDNIPQWLQAVIDARAGGAP